MYLASRMAMPKLFPFFLNKKSLSSLPSNLQIPTIPFPAPLRPFLCLFPTLLIILTHSSSSTLTPHILSSLPFSNVSKFLNLSHLFHTCVSFSLQRKQKSSYVIKFTYTLFLQNYRFLDFLDCRNFVLKTY